MKYAEGISDNFCLKNIVERAQGLQAIPSPSDAIYNSEQLEAAIFSDTPESTDLGCQVERCARGCSIIFESGTVIETDRWGQSICGK
jgi:hypothetical protein